MNMKKKVLIGLVIILFLVIIFGITYMLFLEKRNNGISLIKDNVVIEYGNTYNPNIEELVDLSKYKFINKQEISIENNIENEKDKDYPAVGVYEINIIYKNIILKQKIEIKDTIAPNIEVLENIRIDYNTDLSSFDFKKYFNVTDLSPTKELVVNLSNINSSISGEQTTIASVEDIYSNKKEIELKINILEKAEETQKEKIEKQEQFTNNATSKNSGTIQGTKKNDVKNNKKTQNTTTAAGFTPAAFCSLYKKHRKYIGKRAGKGYNVRESVIDKIQTILRDEACRSLLKAIYLGPPMGARCTGRADFSAAP